MDRAMQGDAPEGRLIHIRVVKLGGIDTFDVEGEESAVVALYKEWLSDMTREAREAREEVERVRAAMPPVRPDVGPAPKPRPTLAFTKPESGGGDV